MTVQIGADRADTGNTAIIEGAPAVRITGTNVPLYRRLVRPARHFDVRLARVESAASGFEPINEAGAEIRGALFLT